MTPASQLAALRARLGVVEAAIPLLEALHSGTELELLHDGKIIVRKSRRGRKFMGAEEREVVSSRMKKYWAGRRAKREA
jgi:hypothetical protein